MANARTYEDGNIAVGNRVMAGWLNPVNTVVFTLFGNGSEYTGNGNFPGNISVAGNTSVSGNAAITGNITVAQKLDVTGNTTLGNLTVGGVSAHTGNSSFGNVAVTGQLSLTGNMTVSGNATITSNMTVGDRLTGTATLLSPITNSLAANVALNNTGNYFNGPMVAQGNVGTWLVLGSVTLTDTAGNGDYPCKLWDGTTVIASAQGHSEGATNRTVISLSGFITSPAGNLRISVNDNASTSGQILFNSSGSAKDSTITAIRIG